MIDTKNTLFIDTDCISAFLWVKNEPLVPKIFPNTVISDVVYGELLSWMKERVDTLTRTNKVRIVNIQESGDVFNTYVGLVDHMELGIGEASCIALSRHHNGIVGSNNLRDVITITNKWHIPLLTTGDILVIAVLRNLITVDEAEAMWKQMLDKRRKIGANSYQEFYSSLSSKKLQFLREFCS